jgi:[protein-PII] uridylyltransferase
MLYLLTGADSRATGDGMWGGWRMTLVREAFTKTLGLIEGQRGREHLDWRRAELRQVLARQYPVAVLSEIDRHLDGLPADYLGAVRTSEQLLHFELMRPAPESGEVRTKVMQDHDQIKLIVTARDRPGLLASVSAALTVNGIDVLAARAFTRSDGVALESYRVADAFGQPITATEWKQVHDDIGADPASVSERLARRAADYRRRLGDARSVEVQVDNRSSDFYTVVEVRAPDRVGLLADLTRALAAGRVDVHVAKIVTEGADALDTFYVWDAAGGKVPSDAHAALRESLTQVAEGF